MKIALNKCSNMVPTKMFRRD